MVLTARKCYDHIRHALGGELRDLSPRDILNQAGRHLASMHRWKWLERPAVRLATRANISITGATWTPSGDPSGLTIVESSGSFADYDFLTGDQFESTGGTGITQQYTEIIQKIDDDKIQLVSSIGTAVAADLAGTVHADACALPSDFREIISIQSNNSLVGSVTLTSLGEIMELRTDQSFTTALDWWVALSWAQPRTTSPSGGAPVARLEYWPSVSANNNSAMSMFYRAKWLDVSNDSDYVSVPDYVEQLAIRLARACALAWEEEDQASLTMRLAEIEQGPEFYRAVNVDKLGQRYYGTPLGGHAAGGGSFRTMVANNGTILGGPS